MARIAGPTVTRIGDGMYRVASDGGGEIVYVVRSTGGWWAFMNGEVFHGSSPAAGTPARRRPHAAGTGAPQALAAPMPATVIKVLVSAGDEVKKGDTVVVLEAMKMELPLRAAGDARVESVHCREGDLVQPETVLVEFA